MKNSIKYLAFLPAFALFTACEAPETDHVPATGRRTVAVLSENVGTRTSIEYEYSDYSHLVWEEGDKVAYLTDFPGETAAVAEVSGGSFDATLPTDAGPDNKLYAVYPAGELAGATLDGLKMPIPAEQRQDTLAASRGIQVPMFAVAPVPAEGQNSVKVRYELPAAVVRFAVTSTEHAEEKVLSVTMEAERQLAGAVAFSGTSGETIFEGSSSRVTTTVATPSMIKDGGYVYMTVMRGTYTNVSVSVTTDKNTYVFDDGIFSLDTPGATLFKVGLPLEGSVPVPPTPYFREVSEGEVFTKDDRYLIAYKKSDTEYYIATTMSNNQLSMQSVEATAEGIEASDDICRYTFRITPVEGTSYYSLYSEAVASDSGTWKDQYYIGGPATSYRDPANFYPGETEPGADDTRFLWNISVAADGVATIAGVMQPDYSICFYGYGNCFAPCTEYVDSISDIALLKLQ